MKSIIAILFSFISNSYAEKTTSINYSQNKCEIRDQTDTIQFNYPGDTCLFLEDGSFIVYKKSDDSTARVNSNGKIIWKKKVGKILSIEFDKTKKTALLFGQQVEKTFLCKSLSKFLVRIDINSGKTLSFLSGQNLIKEIVKTRSEEKKYFPMLSPQNKPEENNNGHDCVLTGPYEVKSIRYSTENNANKRLFDGDVFLYMSHELAAAYILSYDLKKIVWFYELYNPQEEIFKQYIDNDFIYILSFEDLKKLTIIVRKISLLDKKTIWTKKIQLDSQEQHSSYYINDSGDVALSNSATDRIDSSQYKTLSEFLKNKK